MVSPEKAYWSDVPLLTERDLQDIRVQLEGFKAVTAISDEMRDVIETEWPELAAKLLPPRWYAAVKDPGKLSDMPGSWPS